MNELKKIPYIVFTICCLLGSSYSIAASELIDNEAQTFTTTLEKHLRITKAQFPDDPNAIKAVVEEVVLPIVDKKYFAYKVLGKHAVKMSDEQKALFTELLMTSMVSNYMTILRQYNNESLLLETVKVSDSGKTAKTRIAVHSNIGTNVKDKSIVLAWRFNKTKEHWTIYDLEAEGISLLQSKQKEIASLISQQGIEKMLFLLDKKSKKIKKPAG